jgi:hypothetical protein
VEGVLTVTSRDPESTRTLVPRQVYSAVSRSVQESSTNIKNALVIDTTNTGEAKTTKVSLTLGDHTLAKYKLPDGGRVSMKHL